MTQLDSCTATHIVCSPAFRRNPAGRLKLVLRNLMLGLALCFLQPALLVAADAEVASAIAVADVDLSQSSIVTKDERSALEVEAVRELFLPDARKTSRQEWRLAEGSQITLAFRRPIKIGASFLSADGKENAHFVAQVLRGDFEQAPDKAASSDWREVAATHLFDGELQTRAVRLTVKREYRGPLTWLFWQPRWVSLTSAAVGSGEKAPFGSHPNSIPLGRPWVNTDTDPSGGAAKQLQRGPISEATPSWYVLSWDTPQTLDAVWLSGNADEFRLLAYRGEEGLNPAIAPQQAWARVEFETRHERRGGDKRLNDRLLTFPPLRTSALRLQMTNCQRGAVAMIQQFEALALASRSAGQPLAKSAAALPGKSIAFEQPFDGQLAVAITDEEGRTIRNLVAQVDRRSGPNVERWDLKDDAGLTVPPGTYRWKAITSPPLGLRYQMCVYPNAPQIFSGDRRLSLRESESFRGAKGDDLPGSTPWLTGESGANGWLADHAPITSGAVSGDRLYFGAPGVEGGVCLIECDLTGRKQWGKHSFGPFVGVERLAGDDQHVFIHERDSLHRLDPQTHVVQRLAALSSPERSGKVVGMAAHNGQVIVAMSSSVPWLENATRADVVDLEQCLPKFAAKIPDPLGNRRVQPNPRVDFLRLLRLTGTPAGQGPVAADRRESIFPIAIDTSGGGKSQYIVVAFKEPTPLGSVVLPCVGPEYLVDLSVLKPNASYPPNPQDDSQWLSCPEQPRPGWTCVAMPPQVRTQGLRIRVRQAKDAGEDNLVDDLLAEKTPKKKASEFDLDLDRPNKTGGAGKTETKPGANWFARFEGLKLLRRRFTDITAQAKVRVNSGEVNALGEWDAKRTEALSIQDPGVYVLEWPQAKKVAGLAIKEIDGAVTEVDVWDDAASGEPIPLSDAAGWRNVATYKQSRRDAYQPSFERNEAARYLDGYVAFGGEVATRAIRLRVVSQWADNGERGTSTRRNDQGGQSLDPRHCRIAGVAALQYLGDEFPLESLGHQRLEVRDGKTGAIVRELAVQVAERRKPSGVGEATGAGSSSAAEPGGSRRTATSIPTSLAFRSDGTLFGIQHGRVVRIDLQTGATQAELPVIDGQQRIAHRLAIGPDGAFHVFELPEKVIHVYDRAGQKLRTVGHPGGQVPGPWDPEKFRQVETLVVDRSGQTWVVESQDVPRRIVQFDAKGQLVREFLGNTHYGGGGVLDPADKSRLFYHHIEFAIDWKSGRSQIKNMLAEWLPADCVPIRYSGQTYLVTAPLSHQATQPVVEFYRYDETRGTVSLAAAFGEAESFAPLKTPAVLKTLASGKVPKDYEFLWSDQNGNGQVDPPEVTFELKTTRERLQLGRVNDRLRCWAGSWVYQSKAILPNGVPVFVRGIGFQPVTTTPNQLGKNDRQDAYPTRDAATYELTNGDLLALHAPSEQPMRHGDGKAQETRGIHRDGRVMWRYPTEHGGVSGLTLYPWEPGYVSNEFGVIGHATARAGDLGEFVVVHGNNGMWKIWTADGLLAGQLTRHKFDPRSIVDSSQSSVARDQPFDNLTAGQEHFHGYFTTTPDGRAYIVHGHNYIGLWEVTGLDGFKRLSGDVVVTPEDVRSVREQHEELARREAKSQARVLDCLRVKAGELPEVVELDGVRLSLGYDDQFLHARWSVSGHGLLANSGTDFHRYFKTGACLDLQLGTDESVNPARRAPVAGDLRLLFTVAEGQPQAVLYQPVSPNADPQTAWETRTDAGGTTRFDRVVRLTGAKLEYAPDRTQSNRYVFTAAIPLTELRWKPRDGQLLRCDWGVLTSDDGHTVKRRLYWSNTLATGTTDEAWEARLEPHLWGTLAVLTTSRSDRQLDSATPDRKSKPGAAADLLDDILNTTEPKKKSGK